MARKVIIDCDPGIDDALALCLGLFHPDLEIVAVTATAGRVNADQASVNVQTIIEQLDPSRFPRVGDAAPSDDRRGVSEESRLLHGEDGLGNASFPVAQLHHRHPSEKIICDEVRAAPDEVTIICLGPLTNVARAFQRDPDLPAIVDRLVISGGSLNAIGNATPTAEFNIFSDPVGARAVFRSATTKTLVPLNVTNQVNINLDVMEALPKESTRAGQFLQRMLPYFFRAHHQQLGKESILIPDCVALIAATNPEYFTTTEMAGDVETRGDLTTGATVFDRRPNPLWRINMEVATRVDSDAVRKAVFQGLARAGAAG